MLGSVGLSVREFFQHWRTLLRGSFIGVVLGVIPGLGATPAAFLSYGEARRHSRDPNSFGKGNPEGVAAAVILGAFMIHGLQPGPLLFQSNIDVIYALFMELMAGSLMLIAVGMLLIPTLGRIIRVQRALLLPGVLVLSVYGSYAVNNTFMDVLTMMIMGVIGLLMVAFAFPRAPLLIAFVLGPLLEDNFRQSLLMSQGSWNLFFNSPITWLFWTLTVLSIVGTVLTRMRARKGA